MENLNVPFVGIPVKKLAENSLKFKSEGIQSASFSFLQKNLNKSSLEAKSGQDSGVPKNRIRKTFTGRKSRY